MLRPTVAPRCPHRAHGISNCNKCNASEAENNNNNNINKNNNNSNNNRHHPFIVLAVVCVDV